MDKPYPEVFKSFISSSQILGTILVGVVILSSKLRDKLVFLVLGLLWLLTGITFYWRYVGGVYGGVMGLVCVAQTVALTINWRRLKVGSFSFNLDFSKFNVDLKRVDTSCSVMGASTLLVLSLINKESPPFPIPSILAPFSYCLLASTELVLQRDSKSAKTDSFQYFCMKHLGLIVWVCESFADLSTHVLVSSAFLCLCYYFRLPSKTEPLKLMPVNSTPLIEFRPNADGQIQGNSPMPMYQDEDGDYAHEFYVKMNKRLEKVPKEKLRRIE